MTTRKRPPYPTPLEAEHAELMYESDRNPRAARHCGSAHCPCDVAVRLREELDEAQPGTPEYRAQYRRPVVCLVHGVSHWGQE